MANTLLRAAGTFWSDINEDPVFSHLLDAKELVEKQTQSDLEQFRACAGRDTTPLYRKFRIAPLRLCRLDMDRLSWPAPQKLARVPIIANKLLAPSMIWLDKIDFTIEDRWIKFRTDPFTEVKQTEPIYNDAGIVIDTAITLWMISAEYDESYLNDVWGAAVGVSAPSSEEYRTLLSILYDALLGGTSRKHVEQIVSLFSGAPLALEDETVVESTTDSRGPFLATNMHIYRPPTGGSPVVDVGTQLKAGDPLFDTCTFFRSTDNVPRSKLKELTLPKSFLDASIGSDLTFQNRDVPLTYADGHVKFEVGGQPEAVKRFWILFNSRKADKRSLADLMTGKTLVNPLQFVRQNVLRNCLLCVLHDPVTPPQLSGIDQNRLLRLIVPPNEALLIARQ